MFLFYYIVLSVVGYFTGVWFGYMWSLGAITDTELLILVVLSTIVLTVGFAIMGWQQAKTKGYPPIVGSFIIIPYVGFLLAVFLQFTKHRSELVTNVSS
jgi:hypothetical protein